MHAIRPAEAAHDTFQEVRPLRATIEEVNDEIRAVVGDHEAGHTSARAEIDDSGTRCEFREGRHERTSVVHDLDHGTCAEESEILRLGENGEQRVL